MVHSAKCDYPLPQLTDDAVAVLVSGYRDPALEGTNITFTCTGELHNVVLTGPSKSSCMGDGEWEPDPRKVQCKGTTKIDIFYLLHIYYVS